MRRKKSSQDLTKVAALTMRGSCILIAYISVGVFIFFPQRGIYDTPPPPLLFSERQTAVQAKKPFHLH